jgi:hypothetical protein
MWLQWVAEVPGDPGAFGGGSVEGDQRLVRSVIHAAQVFELPRREMPERRQEAAARSTSSSHRQLSMPPAAPVAMGGEPR